MIRRTGGPVVHGGTSSIGFPNNGVLRVTFPNLPPLVAFHRPVLHRFLRSHHYFDPPLTLAVHVDVREAEPRGGADPGEHTNQQQRGRRFRPDPLMRRLRPCSVCGDSIH
jgi:hypothetical protein